jgi:hypothetical protein
MRQLLSSPSLDDLIRLLKAWRFWSVGALIGGLLGAAVFYVAPPPYRAHAVVLVDFNLEEAWPQETDRQQFYYLERETRKLVEIAFSDEVLRGIIKSNPGTSLDELEGKLSLSQPAEGGWNFYADDHDPVRAATLATAWADEFARQARAQRDSGGLNEFIETDMTRIAAHPLERSRPMSLYIFAGAAIFLAVGSIFVLFFPSPQPSPKGRRGDLPE